MDLRRAAVSLRKAAAAKGVDVKVSTGVTGQLQVFKNGDKRCDYNATGDTPTTGQ